MNPPGVKFTCSAPGKPLVFHPCPAMESFRLHILMHEIHSLHPFPCPPRFPLRSWFPVSRLFRICRFFPFKHPLFLSIICPPNIIVNIYCLEVYELPDIFYNTRFSPSHASRNILSVPPDFPSVIHRMSPVASRTNF